MNSLQKMNFLGSLSYEVTKFCDLELNTKIPVSQLRSVDTQFGRRILAVFRDGRAVWLPERFKELNDDFLEGVNNGRDKLTFTYKGKKKSPQVGR